MNILFVDNRSCGWQSVACYGHKKTGGNQGGLLMCGGGGGRGWVGKPPTRKWVVIGYSQFLFFVFFGSICQFYKVRYYSACRNSNPSCKNKK